MRRHTWVWALVIFVAAVGVVAQVSEEQSDAAAAFEERYQAWRSWLEVNQHLSFYVANEPFGEIVKLGLPAVPYIIQKIEENPADFHLGAAMGMITKKRFGKEEWPADRLGDSRTEAALYVEWWKAGRFQSGAVFEELYEEWRTLREEGQSDSAAVYKRIVDLGIAALPHAFEALAGGDEALIPAVARLTDGAVGEDWTTPECVEWWEANRGAWLLPEPEPESEED